MFDRHPKSLLAPYYKDVRRVKELNAALSSLYCFVGADESDQFVFTSSVAESITQVFHSVYFDYTLASGKNQILVVNTEDAPTLLNAARFEEMGCSVEMVPVASNGKISAEILNLYTTPKTGVLFMSYADPLTGVIQPVEEIATFCKKHNILLHLNMDNAIGKVHFNLSETPVDFVSFGRCLFAKSKLSALIPSTGALNQLRGGEFDLDALIEAANEAEEMMQEASAIQLRLTRLRNHFERHFDGALFNTELRLPHISTIAFKGVAADLMLYHLKEAGVTASMGGNDVQKLEHVLVKCGLDVEVAKSALSFTFSSEMGEDEIDESASVIKKAYEKLQPLWRLNEVL